MFHEYYAFFITRIPRGFLTSFFGLVFLGGWGFFWGERNKFMSICEIFPEWYLAGCGRQSPFSTAFTLVWLQRSCPFWYPLNDKYGIWAFRYHGFCSSFSLLLIEYGHYPYLLQIAEYKETAMPFSLLKSNNMVCSESYCVVSCSW